MAQSLVILFTILMLGETTSVAYYEVTAPSTKHLENEIGCYAETDLTTRVHRWTSPIYMKTSPKRYLLQLSNGNWAITEDVFGKIVLIEQEGGNYRVSPDMNTGNWVVKKSKRRSILSKSNFKVKANGECKKEDHQTRQVYEPKEVHPTKEMYITREHVTDLVVSELPPKNMSETSKEKHDSISYYWYVGFGVAGVFLLILYVYHVYLCINPPKMPIVEDNPDYGKMEEYDDDERAYQYGISGVVDQNDYYDTEL